MTLKQSSTVHIQALVSADGILLGISSYHQLFVINLASVPGGQLVNSPTAQSLVRWVLLVTIRNFMNSETKYPIIIRKRTPFVSEFLFTLIIICCLILVVCIFFFGPPLSSNNEMQVVAGIKIIPPNVIRLIFYSAIGFPFFLFLYRHLLINKKAFLSFSKSGIVISTKRKIFEIAASEIAHVEFVDPIDSNEMPRGKFFVIIHRRNLETINIRLKVYYDSDYIVDNLLKFGNLKDQLKDTESFSDPDIDSEI